MRRLILRAIFFVPFAFSLCLHAQQPASGTTTPPDAAIAPTASPAPVERSAPQQAAPLPPPTAANTITRNVSLVVLDGVALDQKGNVVTDLKREDFHVTEDDQPQNIRNFEIPGRFNPAPDVTIDSTADLDRLAPRAPVNIILLDEFNTRFEDMAFARYSLKKWLEKQPDKLETPTMLIAVDLEHFAVLRDYTQSKDEILQALDHHFVANPWRNNSNSWAAERYSTAFISLRRVAEAANGHFGHKNMIWIGRGFPTLNLINVNMDAQTQIHNQVQLTVDELRDARITLYTIDPAGLMVDPGVYGWDAQLYAPFGGEPTFEALSRATGGRNIHGRNDVDAQIGSAIRDGSSLFTLTYTPTNPFGDREKFRRIKVTVDRPGITFVTRQGYYPAIRPARLAPDGHAGGRLMTELASAASSNMDYDAVGFTVTSSPTDANEFRIRVESKGLAYYFTDGSKPRYTRVIVMATPFDKKNKVLKPDGRTYTFVAPITASPTGHLNLPVAFVYKLPPDPKAVRVRFVVRVEASGHMGTADIPLTPGATASSSSAELTPPATPKASPAPASN